MEQSIALEKKEWPLLFALKERGKEGLLMGRGRRKKKVSQHRKKERDRPSAICRPIRPKILILDYDIPHRKCPPNLRQSNLRNLQINTQIATFMERLVACAARAGANRRTLTITYAK